MWVTSGSYEEGLISSVPVSWTVWTQQLEEQESGDLLGGFVLCAFNYVQCSRAKLFQIYIKKCIGWGHGDLVSTLKPQVWIYSPFAIKSTLQHLLPCRVAHKVHLIHIIMWHSLTAFSPASRSGQHLPLLNVNCSCASWRITDELSTAGCSSCCSFKVHTEMGGGHCSVWWGLAWKCLQYRRHFAIWNKWLLYTGQCKQSSPWKTTTCWSASVWHCAIVLPTRHDFLKRILKDKANNNK